MKELDQHKYELLKEYFWVQDFGDDLHPSDWIFHPNGEPKPKTYLTTERLFRWRKPTYEETLRRIEWFENMRDDKNFEYILDEQCKLNRMFDNE